MSFTATSWAGIVGVKVEAAFFAKTIETRDFQTVFVPCVAAESATKVTTPVAVSKV